MGISLHENEVAFRLNLVTLERNYTVMADHSADHISTAEAHEIMASLAPEIESMGMTVMPGVSYRNLLVWPDGPDGCVTHPPHAFPGEALALRFPTGEGSDVLMRLIIKSWKLLDGHPVNERRIKRCQGAANSIWPWGQGRAPRILTLRDRFGITGSVVAAVDLVRGIGKYAGLDIVEVPGATGYIDTNYHGKVQGALDALTEKDFVFVHVEAPDETSHSGQLDLKIKAIEDFDEKVVGPILAGLEKFTRWRILLTPDHRTPIVTRTHSGDPVPFILLDSRQWGTSGIDAAVGYSEEAADASGRLVEDGSKMIEMLLNKQEI